VGALNRDPDATGRHPEGRDKLILARAKEWNRHRGAIRGVQQSILEGEFDDDEPQAVDIANLPAGAVEPVPFKILEAAGAVPDDGQNKGRPKGKESEQAPRPLPVTAGESGLPHPLPNPGRKEAFDCLSQLPYSGQAERTFVVTGTAFKVLFLGPWSMASVVNQPRRPGLGGTVS